MKPPSYADAFEVLCLQAADDGRGDVLFGDCLSRARKVMRPFMIGKEFPSVYLEFPLIGEPFLDVTMLYGKLEPGMYVDSEAVAGTEPMLDWFADACSELENICCGYELDVKDPALPRAAVHFQPRAHHDLVEPFCAAIGEPQRAALFLEMQERMPEEWPLAFFGLFRGRPGSPLRVCGYLSNDEGRACAEDSAHLASVFDQVGFNAYDEAMLAQASELMGAAPGALDFQFDIYDDGHLGDTFAIDIQFAIKLPEVVRDSFEGGPASRPLGLLECWGAADDRWRLVPDAAFARSLEVELEDGSMGRYGFTLMPQWAKARWTDGALQPSKLYHLASAGLLKQEESTTD